MGSGPLITSPPPENEKETRSEAPLAEYSPKTTQDKAHTGKKANAVIIKKRFLPSHAAISFKNVRNRLTPAQNFDILG